MPAWLAELAAPAGTCPCASGSEVPPCAPKVEGSGGRQLTVPSDLGTQSGAVSPPTAARHGNDDGGWDDSAPVTGRVFIRADAK
jgi:hypothetical protein